MASYIYVYYINSLSTQIGRYKNIKRCYKNENEATKCKEILRTANIYSRYGLYTNKKEIKASRYK